MDIPSSIGGIILIALSTATPFVVGGGGYVIHNEGRMSTLEAQVVSVNTQLTAQSGKLDKIYDILLEDAKRKALPKNHP